MKGQDLRVLSGKTIYIALESWAVLPNEFPWNVLGTNKEALQQYVVKGVYGKYLSKTDNVYVYCDYFKTTYYVDIGWVRTWGSTNVIKPGKTLLTHEAIQSLVDLRQRSGRRNANSSSSAVNSQNRNKRDYQSLSQPSSSSSSPSKSCNVQTKGQNESNKRRKISTNFEEQSPLKVSSSSSSSSSSSDSNSSPYRQSPVAVIGAKTRRPSSSSSSFYSVPGRFTAANLNNNNINTRSSSSSSSSNNNNHNNSSSSGRLDYRQFLNNLTKSSSQATANQPSSSLTVNGMWDRLKTISSSDHNNTSPVHLNSNSSIGTYNCSDNDNQIDTNANTNANNNDSKNSSINIGVPDDVSDH